MSVRPARFVLLAICMAAALPLPSYAQAPSGCHPITAEERAALELRDAPVPTSGYFCDADRALLFGSCTSDPLPILLARYTPGTLSSQEGRRGITKLQPEFACRLSRFLTAHPHCIVSGWRSNETQQKLWDEALAKYGSEAEARKYVAPPGKSRHNTGLAVDVCPLSTQAKAALSGFQLYIRLEYEPWHIEGIGLTENEAGIGQAPAYVPSNPTPVPASGGLPIGGTSWLANLSALYQLARGLEALLGIGNVPQGYIVTQVGSTYYLTATTSTSVSGISLADILLAALQGSDAPTIVYVSATSSITVTPDMLATLLPASEDITPPGETTPSVEEQIRKLMLRVIELLQMLLAQLSGLIPEQPGPTS